MEAIGSEISEKENLGSLHSKKLHFIDQRNAADEALQENEQELAQMEKDLKSQVGDKDWFIDAYFRDNNLTAQFRDMSASEKHASDVARTLIKRLESNEELIIDMESLLRTTHQVLSGTNRLSDEMDERFNTVRRRIEGKKSVVWRDDQAEATITVSRHELENMFSLNVFRANASSPSCRKSRKSRQLTSICMTPDSRPSLGSGSGTTTKAKIAVIPPVCKEDEKTSDLNGTFTVEQSVTASWKDVKSSPGFPRHKENEWRSKSPIASTSRSPASRPFGHRNGDNWSGGKSDRKDDRGENRWTKVRSHHKNRNRPPISGYRNSRFNF